MCTKNRAKGDMCKQLQVIIVVDLGFLHVR